MNPTDLVFVFSSGCLSTCRVPGGGTCGQIPGGRVYSVTSRDAGGDTGVMGSGGMGELVVHKQTHISPPIPCTLRRQIARFVPGGSQPSWGDMK